jgi:hypothetical protein
VLEADKIDMEDFEVKYSLIDTGTDAVLRTDQRNVDPSSIRESNARINTAGGHVLTAAGSGTLTAHVVDTAFNMRQIDITDALIVPHLTDNLMSHRPFIEMGHLCFSAKTCQEFC